MGYMRIHKPSSFRPPTQETKSRFAPRPFPVQRNSDNPPAQEEIDLDEQMSRAAVRTDYMRRGLLNAFSRGPADVPPWILNPGPAAPDRDSRKPISPTVPPRAPIREATSPIGEMGTRALPGAVQAKTDQNHPLPYRPGAPSTQLAPHPASTAPEQSVEREEKSRTESRETLYKPSIAPSAKKCIQARLIQQLDNRVNDLRAQLEAQGSENANVALHAPSQQAATLRPFGRLRAPQAQSAASAQPSHPVALLQTKRTKSNQTQHQASISSFEGGAKSLSKREYIQARLIQQLDNRVNDLRAPLSALGSKNVTDALHAPSQQAPIPAQPHLPVSPIQAKLTIGPPNDKYEREADRVASQVVKQVNSTVTAPQKQSVQRQQEQDEELRAKPTISALQRSPLSPAVSRVGILEEGYLQAPSAIQRRGAIKGEEASTDLASAINRARSGGQPLDAELQTKMGQAMGADFSGVKVHTDAQAHQLNQSIQAKAFTTGQDVFFRQGEYQPGSRGGQELIAHELTHVVQQNGETANTPIQRFYVESKNPKGYRWVDNSKWDPDKYEVSPNSRLLNGWIIRSLYRLKNTPPQPNVTPERKEEASELDLTRSNFNSSSLSQSGQPNVTPERKEMAFPVTSDTDQSSEKKITEEMIQQIGPTCGLYSLLHAIRIIDPARKGNEDYVINKLWEKANQVGTKAGEIFDSNKIVKIANTMGYSGKVVQYTNVSEFKKGLADSGGKPVLIPWSVFTQYNFNHANATTGAHWSVVTAYDSSNAEVTLKDPNNMVHNLSVSTLFGYNQSLDNEYDWDDLFNNDLMTEADYQEAYGMIRGGISSPDTIRRPTGKEPLQLRGKMVYIWGASQEY